MADSMVFLKTSLIGGGAGALDNVSGVDRGDTNPLQDGDAALIMQSGVFSTYLYDADSMDAESSPTVIRPDDIAVGDPGRWILQGVSVSAVDLAATITGAGAIAEPLDADELPFYKIVGTLLKKVTWANIKATLKTYFDTLYNLYTHPSGDGNLHVPANSTTNSGKVLTAGAAAGTYTWENSSVADEAITNAKLAHVATSVIKGRVAAGTGDVEDLSAANVRTIINVADGATANDMASPGAIGETAPETIRGKNKEIFKTASADSPLTAAECSGTIVSNYGMTDADCIIDLPTAAEGLSFVCVLPAVRAKYFRLRCPSAQADKIYLLGVAGSDDGYVGVASGYATGAAISMFTFKASDGGYDWFAIPIFGTWVAG